MSTTDAATCATMSDSPRRCLLRGSETADALSFMADRRSAFDARRAGARPSRTPTSIATRNVKKRTRESVPASRIIVPLLALEISAKRALRLLSGYAILQTPHNVEAQPIALGENGIRAAGRLAPRAHIGFVVERNPQIRLGANGDAIEISRRDADDGKWDAIQRDALADDGGIAGKAARPIRIADHHRARRARFFIGIGDTAPQKRSNTKSRKILACDHHAVGQRGLAVDAHGGVLVVKT